MLFALAEAFFFAYLTKRTLIVDWRDTQYLNDGKTNLFRELFECDSFLGVPIRTADIDEAVRGKSRFLVDKRIYETFIARWEAVGDEERAAYWNDIRRLHGGSDHGVEDEGELQTYSSFPLKFVADEVIAAPFIGAVLAYTSKSGSVPERFLRKLKLRAKYRDIVDTFKRDNFAGKRVVGVHVRHGNGEKGDFVEKRRQIANVSKLLEHFECNVTAALKVPLSELAVFLCTDSDVVVAEAKKRIPNLLTRPQWRPHEDAGCSLHLGHLCPGGAVENAANAAIDMFLLGSCDYLAQLGNGSWFSKVAARLIGRDKVLAFDAPPPDIDDHVFSCIEMPAGVACRGAGRASLGKAGYLVFGPYVPVEREGRYVAELTYQTMSCPGAVAGTFDAVVSRRDETGGNSDFSVLGRIALTPTENGVHLARLEFDTSRAVGMLLELRVHVETDVAMNAFHIRTRRLDALTPQPVRTRIGSAVRHVTGQVWSTTVMPAALSLAKRTRG